MTDIRFTGGCQCGAVRYELTVMPDNPCLCHCRMCQKQVGGYFGAFVGLHSDHFRVTRGQIAHFRSSADANRGFCRDCGTPLTYEAISRRRVEVTIGSLDNPAAFKPVRNIGAEGMAPWWDELAHLPTTSSGEGDNGVGDTEERFAMIKASNHQHPDHDTDHWPPI